jgi:hypothetical protein
LAIAIGIAFACPAAVEAETAARFSFQVPVELTRLLGQEGAELQYALVGLPDGGAAIQTSVRVHDDGPFDFYALDESMVTILDSQGHVAREFAVPKLDMNGGDIVGVLAGGALLMMRDGKGYASFAALTLDGSVLWQRQFDVGTYGNFPPPIATANGGFAFLDEFIHSSSCLLRPLDRHGGNLAPTELQDPQLHWDAMHISGEFLLELTDGGYLAQCSFADLRRETLRSLMFRIDRFGRELWNRPLRLSILGGREETSGAVLLLANDSQEQGDVVTPQPPLPGSPFGWLAVRVGLDDGEVLDIKQIEPTEIPWSGYRTHPAGDHLVLPDGGMILSTRPKDDWGALGSLLLTRVDPAGAVIWERPIVPGDEPGDLCPPGCYQTTGIAVVNGQVLVAVYGWHLDRNSPRSGIYVVPFD